MAIGEIQPSLRCPSQIQPNLFVLGQQLVLHWRLLDTDFWAELLKNAAVRPAQGKMLDFLIQDLKEVKVKHFSFFEKHAAEPGPGLYPLIRDFTEFVRAVMDRFQLEEEYLLPILRDLL
jgi:hypothetical protein